MSDRFIQDHLVAMGKEPHQKISAMAGKMQGVLKLAGGDPYNTRGGTQNVHHW